MLKGPPKIRVVIEKDEQLLPWLERVREEGITVVIEREWVASLVVTRAEERRPGVVFPYVVYPSTATEEEIRKALSVAGVWKDMDTDTMLHEIYGARHRPETRPPVTF